MTRLEANPVQRYLGRQERIREATLLSFCDPPRDDCSHLRHLSGRQWEKLLYWLDTSGLALYFLDRITRLMLCDLLPQQVLFRLQRNLADNTVRTRAMMAEQTAIQSGFQNAGLSYAVLKGFSLWPSSTPGPELRSQLDLDFLVAERCAPMARHTLEARGYRLHAISGRSWEFKLGQIPGTSIENIYRNLPHSTVELHLETESLEHRSLLARTETRLLDGISTPVLSPVDLLLEQGLHLFKHTCSEFSRTAHLVEFRRHVIARRDDDRFWTQLRSLANENSRAPIALGVVTHLIASVMGEFAPRALTTWTVDRLPSGARLWVEMYGRRSVFASVPGSKLYLLLQKELECSGVPARRPLWSSLLPRSLPPAITHAPANESLLMRLRRYRIQLHFIFFRLRFHAVEGVRYLFELRRWQHYKNGLPS